MLRTLLLLALVAVALWWLSRLGRRLRQARERSRGLRETFQPMVRCARCGVHLPATQALTGADGQPYCCAEHRDQPG